MQHFSQTIMSYCAPFFELVVVVLNIFSILILILGAVIAGIHFLKNEYSGGDRLIVVQEINSIKRVLGSYILLSLEILIAADIIESIIKPTFEDLFTLATLVIIRTFISYFLNREIQEMLQQTPPTNKKK